MERAMKQQPVPNAPARASESVPCLVRPGESFGYRLWTVTHAWQRRVEAVLTPLGLTHMQYVLLAKTAWLLHQGEAPSQTRIACAAQIDRMMASKVLRTLEEKGFVARSEHPDDPRANSVALTPAGRAALNEAIPIVRATQDAFFGRLGPEGQAALAEHLDRLIALEGRG